MKCGYMWPINQIMRTRPLTMNYRIQTIPDTVQWSLFTQIKIYTIPVQEILGFKKKNKIQRETKRRLWQDFVYREFRGDAHASLQRKWWFVNFLNRLTAYFHGIAGHVVSLVGCPKPSYPAGELKFSHRSRFNANRRRWNGVKRADEQRQQLISHQGKTQMTSQQITICLFQYWS